MDLRVGWRVPLDREMSLGIGESWGICVALRAHTALDVGVNVGQ